MLKVDGSAYGEMDVLHPFVERTGERFFFMQIRTSWFMVLWAIEGNVAFSIFLEDPGVDKSTQKERRNHKRRKSSLFTSLILPIATSYILIS